MGTCVLSSEPKSAAPVNLAFCCVNFKLPLHNKNMAADDTEWLQAQCYFGDNGKSSTLIMLLWIREFRHDMAMKIRLLTTIMRN